MLHRSGGGVGYHESSYVKRTRLRERAVSVASSVDCQECSLRDQCLGRGAKGNRARRVSAVRRLLPTPSSVELQTGTPFGDALERCGGSEASSYLDRPLAQATRRSNPPGLSSAKSVSPHLVPLVRSVLIGASAGTIGSLASLGGDHRERASAKLSFPLF